MRALSLNRNVRYRWLFVAALVALATIFVVQFKVFHASLARLGEVPFGLLLICISLAILTYLVAALTYQFLALHRLSYQRTLVVQLASSFANRVLPAGSGGIALNIAYLRQNKHNLTEAAAVAATNNLLGFIGNILLLSTLFLISPSKDLLHWHKGLSKVWLLALVCLVVVSSFVLYGLRHSERLKKIRIGFRHTLSVYRRRPHKIVYGLLSSIALSCSYSLLALVCAKASGASVSLIGSVLVMSAGSAASTVIATPGGIGSAEAGLTGAYVALGVGSDAALAAALLYRLCTFWLPLVFGAFAFKWLRFEA